MQKTDNPKTAYYLSKFKGASEADIFKTGIYQISFTGSDKTYIGSTSKINPISWKSGFYNRWKQHLLDLQKGKHPNPKIQHMYNKYGEDAIKFSIIEICDNQTKAEILDKEHALIRVCNNVAKGLNLVDTIDTFTKCRETLKKKGTTISSKYLYVFDKNRQLLHTFSSYKECQAALKINRNTITNGVKKKILCRDQYYFSNTNLCDESFSYKNSGRVKNKKTIVVFNSHSNTIEELENVNTFHNIYPDVPMNDVWSAIKGTIPSTKGFIIKYKHQTGSFRISTKSAFHIYKDNLLTKEFDSAVEICEYTGVSYGTLFRQLKGESTKLKDVYDVRRVKAPIAIYQKLLNHPQYNDHFRERPSY